MASTYTANSGIEKIGAGEQAGAWGTTTNNNLDILDRAINGVGAITLSGTTHTLTTSDGTLSDGGFKVLVLGGSPSGTNTITISPNDQDKVYIVVNGSGQTATFTQGSGGNVSVLNGDSKIIYADGAGSGAAARRRTRGRRSPSGRAALARQPGPRAEHWRGARPSGRRQRQPAAWRAGIAPTLEPARCAPRTPHAV